MTSSWCLPDQLNSFKREVVKFQSTGDSYLESNKFYIPEAPSFPRFNAFTIDLDHLKQSTVLWSFRKPCAQRWAISRSAIL
jgi:hypothetical protein